MRIIIILCANILRRTFLKKGNWVTFLILPLLGVFAALAFNNDGTSVTKVAIYNLDKTYIAQDMVNSIEKNENFQVIRLDKQTGENYEELLKNKKVDCVLKIPNDFSNQILNKSVSKLNLISEEGKQVTVWIENYINFYIDNLVKLSEVSNGDKTKFQAIYDEYRKNNLKITKEYVYDQTKSKGTTKQSIGFLLVLMLMASKVITDSILSDKQNRTFFRILSTPVTKLQYITANFISNMVVFGIQIGVLLFVSISILKLNFYINTPTLVLVFILFGMVAVTFGVIIAAFSKSTSQSSQLQNIIIVPTSMLSGCFWPIDIMPNFFKKISVIFPQTWVLKTIDELQFGKSLKDIKIYLLLICVFSIVMFFVGVIKFKFDENIKNII